MERGPFTASEALKNGLVTHIGYADELGKELDKKVGKDTEQVGVQDYLAYGDGVQGEPKARVALIYGTGIIADHGSATDVPMAIVAGAPALSAGAFNDAAD